MREIDTSAKQGSLAGNSKAAQIEIVNWSNADSDSDSSSHSQSVCLQQLMVGQGGASDEKLTIDNLWKILSHEKPTDKQVDEAPARQEAIRSRSRANLFQ